MQAPPDLTTLLASWSGGDEDARDRLLPVVYDELREIAHRCLRDEGDAWTLHTTALVHEAYVRLVDLDRTTFHNRAYFFAVAARAMRRILVDHARGRRRQRRGGGARPLALDTPGVFAVAEERADELLALDEAIGRLTARDAHLGRVVEYRFFGGLTADEIGTVLNVPPAQVYRDWAVARAWLARDLAADPAP